MLEKNMKKYKFTLLILPLIALTACGKKNPPVTSPIGSTVVVPDNSTTPAPTNPQPSNPDGETGEALAVYQFNQLDAEVGGGDFNIPANSDLQTEIFDTFNPNIITNATKSDEATSIYYKPSDGTYNSPLKLGKSKAISGGINFNTTSAVSKIVIRAAAWHKLTAEFTVNGVSKSVTCDHASPFVASDYTDLVFEFDATTAHTFTFSERSVITTISLFA